MALALLVLALTRAGSEILSWQPLQQRSGCPALRWPSRYLGRVVSLGMMLEWCWRIIFAGQMHLLAQLPCAFLGAKARSARDAVIKSPEGWGSRLRRKNFVTLHGTAYRAAARGEAGWLAS